jgi:hypothetical protein
MGLISNFAVILKWKLSVSSVMTLSWRFLRTPGTCYESISQTMDEVRNIPRTFFPRETQLRSVYACSSVKINFIVEVFSHISPLRIQSHLCFQEGQRGWKKHDLHWENYRLPNGNSRRRKELLKIAITDFWHGTSKELFHIVNSLLYLLAIDTVIQ